VSPISMPRRIALATREPYTPDPACPSSTAHDIRPSSTAHDIPAHRCRLRPSRHAQVSSHRNSLCPYHPPSTLVHVSYRMHRSTPLGTRGRRTRPLRPSGWEKQRSKRSILSVSRRGRMYECICTYEATLQPNTSDLVGVCRERKSQSRTESITCSEHTCCAKSPHFGRAVRLAPAPPFFSILSARRSTRPLPRPNPDPFIPYAFPTDDRKQRS
jgi:hypothetical protein